MDILAIVGRPNVGKSALFNRIIGRRIAIVHEQAGVTRDRVSAVAHWGDKTFELIDTGGLAFLDDEKTGDALAESTRQQAGIAIGMASALILVVDVTAGVTPLDREIASRLRASGKPVFLAVNKVDNPQRERAVPEFTELGFDRVFPIAAIHGPGVETLVEAATAAFAPATAAAAAATPTKIAIVGRPNVGKSSLINCLLQDSRAIVSEVPGTTRDSLDVPVTIDRDGQPRPYVLIDTAGLRHQRKIKTSVDQFGLMRAQESIRNCDVAVLVLDARDGVTQQDKHIGGLIAEARRGCVILVNKWDLVREELGSRASEPQSLRASERPSNRPRQRSRGRGDPQAERVAAHLATVRRGLFFLDWAAVLFGSAKTGERVRDLFRLVDRVQQQLQQRVDTPQLNQLLGRAQEAYPAPATHGRRLRIYYAFQSGTQPPTFALFVNNPRSVTPHYERYLISRLRAAWGFEGCPVRLTYRARVSRPGPGTGKNPKKNRRFS